MFLFSTRERATTASASLILPLTDVPSFLTNHLGLPSGTLQSLLHIRNTHVPWKRTQVFLSLWQWKLLRWKALGFQWGLSTCRNKVELLSNAQLIKLWCVPSPCRSSPFLLAPPCSVCSSNYPQPYLCFISPDWVCAFYFFFHSIKASSLARECSLSVQEMTWAAEDLYQHYCTNGFLPMWVTFCCLDTKVPCRSSGLETICYIQSTEQS